MRKNFESNLILVVVLVLESEGLWCSLGQSVDKTKIIGSRETTGPGGYQIFWKWSNKTQTVDYCFHHANEYVTTIVPLFSNPKKTVHCKSTPTTPFDSPFGPKGKFQNNKKKKFILLDWPIILSGLLIFCDH